MNAIRLPVVVALVLAAMLAAGPAAAQASRTWVSGVGDDANPCSRTAPCKTFAGAISKTATGGEISVLDPGGFGTLTITRAITLDGNGQLAGMLASGGINAININAPGADVVLRNLSIEGTGSAQKGIRYINAASVTIDGVVIRGFDRGISFEGGIGVTGRLRVVDSVLQGNGTAIFLVPDPSSTVNATIARTQLLNNQTGLRAESGSRVAVAASTIAGNTLSGVNAFAPSGTPVARVSVDGSLVSGNGVGVKSTQANATVYLGGSTVAANDLGLQPANGGALRSFGDNQVRDNATDGAPSATEAMR